MTSTQMSLLMCVQGGTKKKETFMEAVRGAWTLLTSRSGSVKVDFGQPFSVKVGGSKGGGSVGVS